MIIRFLLKNALYRNQVKMRKEVEVFIYIALKPKKESQSPEPIVYK